MATVPGGLKMTDLQKEAIKRMFRDTVNCPECGAEVSEIDFDVKFVRWGCGSSYYLDDDEFGQSVYCLKNVAIKNEQETKEDILRKEYTELLIIATNNMLETCQHKDIPHNHVFSSDGNGNITMECILPDQMRLFEDTK